MEPLFAFPNIVRFSWGTVEPFLTKAVKVEWPHDKELDKANAPAGTQSITSFLQAPVAKQKAVKRSPFFADRRIQDVTDF